MTVCTIVVPTLGRPANLARLEESFRTVDHGASCDLLFVCKTIEEYPDCVAAVERDVPAERREEAAARLEEYAAHVEALRRAARKEPVPLSVVADGLQRLRDVVG